MTRENQWTIVTAGRAFRNGRLTPTALLNELLDRIRTDEPDIRAYLAVMAEEARLQAEKAELELRNGFDRGPLHGIPISIKDNIAYAGVPLTNGSGRTPPFIPQAHAAAVNRLHLAGAVIVGKAHLYEFAYAQPHPDFGWTRNPYGAARLPGGSSSGSAAGVAAGLALGSIGTDTAGSVRVPASFCGVAGFKPSAGRINLAGVTPLAPTLDQVGVIARNSEDAKLLFDALDETRRPNSQTPVFCVMTDYLAETADPEIRKAVADTARMLERRGFAVRELDTGLPIGKIKETAWTILHYEAYQAHNGDLADWSSGYSERMRNNLELAGRVTEWDYLNAMEWRDSSRYLADRLFKEADVVIAPTCPVTAGYIDDPRKGLPVNGLFTPLANLWGLPALSIPIGFSSKGLPIGLQILGGPGKDAQVLEAGFFCDRALKLDAGRPDSNEGY